MAPTPPQTTSIVEQIKATLDGQKVGNFTIKYTSLDDSSAAKNGDWDGTVETSNANKAANDPDAMVYIGTYNSGAAKLSIPILNGACLVMISPANSYPGLTKAVDGVTAPGEPDSYYPGGYRNYARVINTDDDQGGASSEWAHVARLKKAYVLDDGQTYGQGIGARVGAAFRQDRRQGRQRQRHVRELRPEGDRLRALAQKIKSSGADVVFVGAITGQGTGKLWKDIKAANPNITMFGPDGVNREVVVRRRGQLGQRHVPDLRRRRHQPATGAGKTWADEYKAAHNGDPAADLHRLRPRPPRRSRWRRSQKAATNDRCRSSRPSWARVLSTPSSARSRSTRTATPKGGVISSYQVGDQLAARVQGRHHPVASS